MPDARFAETRSPIRMVEQVKTLRISYPGTTGSREK